MMTVGAVCLWVPGSLAYRDAVLSVVAEACRLWSPPEHQDPRGDELQQQTLTAVSEAFNNIAIHGYGGLALDAVELEISWTSAELVIAMTDNGRSFDPSGVEPPQLDELPEGGMGLLLMRASMNELHYEPGPPNKLRMTKRRTD